MRTFSKKLLFAFGCLAFAIALGVALAMLSGTSGTSSTHPVGKDFPSQPQVQGTQQAMETRHDHFSPAPVDLFAVQFAALKKQQDAAERQTEFEAMVESIGTADIPHVVSQLWQDQTEIGKNLREQLLRKWAEQAPAAAARWTQKQSKGVSREESVRIVATAWAEENFEAALRWVREFEGNEEAAGLAAIAYEVARTAPLEAMHLALELPPDQRRDDLLSHVSGLWASSDPTVAIDWARQVAPGALRDEVLASMATAWSETDPMGAANLVLEAIPAGKKQEDTVVSVVQRWAQSEPEAAAQWVIQFPEGALRDTALENVVRLWVEQDEEKTSDWLGGLSAGPIKDAALSAFISSIGQTKPEAAAQWAEHIQDPAIRQRELELLSASWLENDFTTAQAWLQSSPSLSPEAKSRLLRAAQKHHP
jgi:hypothetical protein